MEKKESRKNARTYILKPGEIIPPKYDFIFTQIFNDPSYGFALNKLLPYNIQICSIKPGDAKTNFTKNRKKDKLNENSPYKDAFDHCLNSVAKDEQNGIEPIKIAKVAFNISKKKRMPYSKSIGVKDKFLALVYHILPKRIRNYLLYKIYAS